MSEFNSYHEIFVIYISLQLRQLKMTTCVDFLRSGCIADDVIDQDSRFNKFLMTMPYNEVKRIPSFYWANVYVRPNYLDYLESFADKKLNKQQVRNILYMHTNGRHHTSFLGIENFSRYILEEDVPIDATSPYYGKCVSFILSGTMTDEDKAEGFYGMSLSLLRDFMWIIFYDHITGYTGAHIAVCVENNLLNTLHQIDLTEKANGHIYEPHSLKFKASQRNELGSNKGALATLDLKSQEGIAIQGAPATMDSEHIPSQDVSTPIEAQKETKKNADTLAEIKELRNIIKNYLCDDQGDVFSVADLVSQITEQGYVFFADVNLSIKLDKLIVSTIEKFDPDVRFSTYIFIGSFFEDGKMISKDINGCIGHNFLPKYKHLGIGIAKKFIEEHKPMIVSMAVIDDDEESGDEE